MGTRGWTWLVGFMGDETILTLSSPQPQLQATLLPDHWPTAEPFIEVVMAPNKAMVVAHICHFDELFQTEHARHQQHAISEELTYTPVCGKPLQITARARGYLLLHYAGVHGTAQ